MVRTFLITICLCTSVLANDIYVSQTTTTQSTQAEDNKAAFKEPVKDENFEKNLINNQTNQQYCSVIAGCQ
jgi:hypothetical protein